MASIIKKRKGNQVYYYAAQCQRVNGKPRIVWQKYLGKLEDIVAKMSDHDVPKPYAARVFQFGAVAALYHIAQRLQLVDKIDRHAPKRAQGGTVGEYMLVAAINRAADPKSKRQIGEWFEGTALRRFLPHMNAKTLASQRFWDHMGYLDQKKIQAIEKDLTEHMVKVFDLDLQAVVYDATNFVSYIDTGSESELAQRGNSKAKRHDLKQISLALMVTMDYHIPLFHDVYPGNRPDAVQFASVTEQLVERYKLLAKHCEHITIVWDKGNNSKSNQQAFDAQASYHVVGSLSPSQHLDLLAQASVSFGPMKGEYIGHKAFRTRRLVMGKERTVVVVFNPARSLGQQQGLLTKLKKVEKALRELCKKLERRRVGEVKSGRAPTYESIEKQVSDILKDPEVRAVIQTKLTGGDIVPELVFEIDQQSINAMVEQRFGKLILFSDNQDWTNEEILAAYRGQFHIEDAFKQMKDPHFVGWSPMFHWTDSMIRVHAFYCVIALTLSSLLWREVCHQFTAANKAEQAPKSIPALLESLEGIAEVAHIYPPQMNIQDHLTLSQMNQQQKTLFATLGLERFAPRCGNTPP
jgi:transposase